MPLKVRMGLILEIFLRLPPNQTPVFLMLLKKTIASCPDDCQLDNPNISDSTVSQTAFTWQHHIRNKTHKSARDIVFIFSHANISVRLYPRSAQEQSACLSSFVSTEPKGFMCFPKSVRYRDNRSISRAQ